MNLWMWYAVYKMWPSDSWLVYHLNFFKMFISIYLGNCVHWTNKQKMLALLRVPWKWANLLDKLEKKSFFVVCFHLQSRIWAKNVHQNQVTLISILKSSIVLFAYLCHKRTITIEMLNRKMFQEIFQHF